MPVSKQRTGLAQPMICNLWILLHNEKAKWLCPDVNHGVSLGMLELTVGATLPGVRVGMSAWLGTLELCLFPLSRGSVLFLFPVPGLVFPTAASILTHWHSTFPLPAFSCSADTSFNSSSSFAFPSSHPPPSCPILPQTGLTPVSLLIPSCTHSFVPWKVGSALLFSCSCLTGEGSLHQLSQELRPCEKGERGQITPKHQRMSKMILINTQTRLVTAVKRSISHSEQIEIKMGKKVW